MKCAVVGVAAAAAEEEEEAAVGLMAHNLASSASFIAYMSSDDLKSLATSAEDRISNGSTAAAAACKGVPAPLPLPL